jgi:hypothetical protein
MPLTLYDLIPRAERPANEILLGQFLEYTASKRLELYSAQESAILELFAEKNVILHTPTDRQVARGAALRFKAWRKANLDLLPNKGARERETAGALPRVWPGRCRVKPGDASVNRDALILCCRPRSANIALAKAARQCGKSSWMSSITADRGGGAWQVPLTLPGVLSGDSAAPGSDFLKE